MKLVQLNVVQFRKILNLQLLVEYMLILDEWQILNIEMHKIERETVTAGDRLVELKRL